MKQNKIKELKNVLLNVEGNKLQLFDILFDSKINEIKPKSEKVFEWNDLKEKTKRDLLLNEYVETTAENSFLLAVPGGIDPHVHFDTPGLEFREDFQYASRAALHGGTTTIIDMPCTSLPPVTDLKNFRIKMDALKGKGGVNYFLWGGVSGNNYDEKKVEKNIHELADAGVIGFKVYMLSGMESYSDLSEHQLEFVARVISRTGLPMAVHAEDRELVAYKEKRFKAMDRNNWQAYCESRDVQAEASAINKLIHISEKTGCKIHIVHLSSELGLRSIKEAQKNGLPITTETCPHYLYFTQKDFCNESIRNFLKTAPPVKFEEDKNALWKGLADGSILFVTTDHAGCNPEKEKTSRNFWNVYGGIPGVEHRVPFLFSEGFLKEKISLRKTIELLSTNVATYFGIKSKGKIEIGCDADFTLIDIWNSKTVRASEMHSKGKYTPFEGVRFNAVVKESFVLGKNIN
jgi:allantoinase